MSIAVIIPAGGSGSRFGSQTPKQFLELDGVPIIIRTLQVFENHPKIDSIIISVNTDWYEHLQNLCTQFKITKVKEYAGSGSTRQMSVANAISTSTASESEIILIHDAVRPFISNELIDQVIEAAEEYGAAVPIVTPKETVKEVASGGNIIKTLDRNKIALVQTPQAFWTDIITVSLSKARERNFDATDDASLAEFAGYKVKTIKGDDANIKITTPFDMKLGELLAKS